MEPFPGLAPNLVPNPPGAMPEAPGAGNPMAGQSAFREALDMQAIFDNLVLDRPLKLFIPPEIKRKYADQNIEYHIINNIPQEMTEARNKGWREPNDEIRALFSDLVAGTDSKGQAYRPMLMIRPIRVGNHIRRQGDLKLASLYAGMDPKNREFQSGYAKNAKDVSEATFSGPSWRIRVRPA